MKWDYVCFKSALICPYSITENILVYETRDRSSILLMDTNKIRHVQQLLFIEIMGSNPIDAHMGILAKWFTRLTENQFIY